VIDDKDKDSDIVALPDPKRLKKAQQHRTMTSAFAVDKDMAPRKKRDTPRDTATSRKAAKFA
jgi:hypothetical protein